MPEFLNTNPHEAYVENPGAKGGDDDPLLPRIPPLSKVSASGAYADRLRETPGIVDLSALDKPDAKRAEAEAEALRVALFTGGPGQEAYPATATDAGDYSADQLRDALAARGLSTEGKKNELADRLQAVIGTALAEPSGQHITGRDSGRPVASDAEPTPHKDGTGDDPHEPVTAVERGVVETGDPKPQGEHDNPQGSDASDSDKPDTGPPTPTADELESFDKKQLVEAAEARGLSTDGTKADLVARLQEAGVGQAGTISTESGAATKAG